MNKEQQEGNTEYIDLCREEIFEIEEAISELEINKEETVKLHKSILSKLKTSGVHIDNLEKGIILDYIQLLEKDKKEMQLRLTNLQVLYNEKIGGIVERQDKLDIANKKLEEIKELVNKYGYYTLSEIPELLSIIGGE